MCTINITSQSIEVHSTNQLTLDDLLDILNNVEDDQADAILEAMPKDYDFIMNQEQYGTLFALGSPQLFECEWKYEYAVTMNGASLKITGFQ